MQPTGPSAISLNSGLNDSSVMDFICIFISLVVHVTAKIMSCSCSALNADSNDTKVDQDWQKVMVRINDIYSLATHKYQPEVFIINIKLQLLYVCCNKP